MVSLKGENPISGDNVDATNPRDWMRYAIGGGMLVAALVAARGGVDIVSERLNIREQAEDSLPSLT